MMTVASLLGPVSTFIRDRVARLLASHRVVVWYDAEGAFAALVPALSLPDCVVVAAGSSPLRARREAEAVYRRLDEPGGSPEARRSLLVYVPSPRGATPEQQQQDPFEAFARCGAVFGTSEGERLASLAQQALPDRAPEVARLFRDGRPTLDLLDALPSSARFPLLRQALGTDSPVDAIAAALSQADAGERVTAVTGALPELGRLAHAGLGLPLVPAEPWPELRWRLGAFLLVGELAFDLPDGLPSSLATVPHPEPAGHRAVFDVCDRLRENDAGREALAALAAALDRDLRLPAVLDDAVRLGSRDTFPTQDRVRLERLVQAAGAGDLPAARALSTSAERSLWRRDPERALLWQAAMRCLAFLDLAAAFEAAPLPDSARGLVDSYIAVDGLWTLDRAQRLFEHAAAGCAQDDEVDPLVQHCRARYRTVVGRAQAAFQAAVRAQGWPPEGLRRQTQVFDAHVAPELADRRRTAYFLVDSLRYEMGRDLAEAMQELGAVTVEGAASTVPATTDFGMAALLPGADGTLSVVEHHGDLAPAIGNRPLPGRAERRALLADRLGDRSVDIELDDLLSTAPRRLPARLGVADLIVVRTLDIDRLGEAGSIFRARKLMSDIIGDLRRAAVRLVEIGVQTLVFAADHGHMLVPELPAGDVLAVPPGNWPLRKRRCLLGQARVSPPPGVLIFPAREVGIHGAAEDFAVASDFKTFQAGAGYFHEGLSLQECVIPVVVVRARRPQAAAVGGQVSITYRSDRFTSSVVGLKLSPISVPLDASSLAVRLEAYDGTGPKARAVGQAGDCNARDPVTGEIVLPPGVETQVPLVVDPDFHGRAIEVRAIDPRTGAVLGRLSLQNARLD